MASYCPSKYVNGTRNCAHNREIETDRQPTQHSLSFSSPIVFRPRDCDQERKEKRCEKATHSRGNCFQTCPQQPVSVGSRALKMLEHTILF
jgi:hypothetical protein